MQFHAQNASALFRFSGIKVQLDFGAVGVGAKQLPGACTHLALQFVWDLRGSEAGFVVLQATSRKRHVIDHACGLSWHRAIPVNMQDGVRCIGVEPCARKPQVGAITLAQSEHAAVERQGLFTISRHDGEVVHRVDHVEVLSQIANWRVGRQTLLYMFKRFRRSVRRVLLDGSQANQAASAVSRAAVNRSPYAHTLSGSAVQVDKYFQPMSDAFADYFENADKTKSPQKVGFQRWHNNQTSARYSD